MATTRPNVVQQPRGDGVVGGGKQQKKNAAVGRSRRPLENISNDNNENLVAVRGNEGKVQALTNRPITRSFCAQLVANAQAAAAADCNKNKVCVNVGKVSILDGGAAKKKAPVPKPAQKKVAAAVVKPKSEEVIEISPDTPGKKQENVQLKKKKEGEGSSKKKTTAYSSILTARSKAVCYRANAQKEVVVDIDAKDADNHLAGVEYVEDIYMFYKSVENESRPHSYMHKQTEITEKMRGILMDWLVEVHLKFELNPETLYLTINIIDRFLSLMVVPRRELQLLGISAMLLASKYEEIWPPQVSDLVCISDNAYSPEKILMMEKTILGKLEWYLTVPTHYVFIARFIKASIPEGEMENMVHFLAELGMMHYETLMYCPSLVAASAVYAARVTLNKSPAWTPTLKRHTGYTESQLTDCAKLLACLHSQAGLNKLRAVYKKYSKSERGLVALIPPAKSLLPDSVSV